MSILATSRPGPTFANGQRRCPRCGQDWTDKPNRWKADAPCGDCRYTLEREDPTRKITEVRAELRALYATAPRPSRITRKDNAA